MRPMLLRRLDRICEDKRSPPIDLTYADFCKWQKAASEARCRFLAGDISEKEALQIAHVPTFQELRKSAMQSSSRNNRKQQIIRIRLEDLLP